MLKEEVSLILVDKVSISLEDEISLILVDQFSPSLDEILLILVDRALLFKDMKFHLPWQIHSHFSILSKV